MKTKESRFQVHDELTAPERSLPVLKGALAGGGQLSNFVGVLAGSPATLRAYARFRSELRHGLRWRAWSPARQPRAGHGRPAAGNASPAAPITTERSSWSASAGPVRSCSC